MLQDSDEKTPSPEMVDVQPQSHENSEFLHGQIVNLELSSNKDGNEAAKHFSFLD